MFKTVFFAVALGLVSATAAISNSNKTGVYYCPSQGPMDLRLQICEVP